MTDKPVMVDLFCKAGGATKGYQRAGFYVVGVDIEPQPNYCGDEFHQADATTFPLDGFDVLAGSPPCEDHSVLAALHAKSHGTGWMLDHTRQRFKASGLPYVLENVGNAHMPGALVLCGSEFGLTTRTELHGQVWLRRHRQFESNVFLWGAGGCNCYGKLSVPVFGHGAGGKRNKLRGRGMAQAAREVMGIDWMTRDELDKAIPPAYTEFIGGQLLEAIEAAA